jgi:hypothetical protein
VPTYTDMVARAQDHFLDALKRAEDRSVGIVESAGRAAVGIVPTRTLIGRLDSAVPRPERAEVVKLTIGFSERLISQQRDYAERLAAALDTAASQARSVPKRSQGTQTKKATGRPRTTTGTRSSSARDKRATSVDGAASRT